MTTEVMIKGIKHHETRNEKVLGYADDFPY